MAEYIEREALLEKARELAQNFSSSCLATPHIMLVMWLSFVNCRKEYGNERWIL